MFRVICLFLAVVLSQRCVALEIHRVATCSGVILRLRGTFDDGDYTRFESHFHRKGTIIGIDLSSDGGDLEEGVLIANLIHQRKLVVYVVQECNSICAYVFFAAVKRYRSQTARIGVHSASNYLDIEDRRSMRRTLMLAKSASKLGVPKSAIAKMVKTRPSNVTYLDRADFAALDTRVGDPFRYKRPAKLGGNIKEHQSSCSR
jgi:hypothetical protein